MAAKTRLGDEGYGVRRVGNFGAKTPDSGSGSHPVGILTRFSADGYGVRRYSSFAGKTPGASGGAHPVGVLTRFSPDGYGVRRYLSFAGKTPEVVAVVTVTSPSVSSAGDIVKKRASAYRSTARHAAYIDVHAQMRRDEARAERERLEAESLKPQNIEPPKIVAPVDATLAQLGPTERANEIVAQMQRQAQLAAADLQNIRRKRDDEEAIALLLLS